jgi:hypothetical protein
LGSNRLAERLTDATGFVDKVVCGWGADGITIFQKDFPLGLTPLVSQPGRISPMATNLVPIPRYALLA